MADDALIGKKVFANLLPAGAVADNFRSFAVFVRSAGRGTASTKLNDRARF